VKGEPKKGERGGGETFFKERGRGSFGVQGFGSRQRANQQGKFTVKRKRQGRLPPGEGGRGQPRPKRFLWKDAESGVIASGKKEGLGGELNPTQKKLKACWAEVGRRKKLPKQTATVKGGLEMGNLHSRQGKEILERFMARMLARLAGFHVISKGMRSLIIEKKKKRERPRGKNAIKKL